MSPQRGGQVLCATRLAPDLLAMVVRLDPALAAPQERALLCERAAETVRLDTRWCKAASAVGEGDGTWLLTASSGQRLQELTGDLSLSDDEATLPAHLISLDGVLATAEEFAACCETELDQTSAENVPHFLGCAPGAHGVELTADLAATLGAIRDQLRRQLSTTVLAPGPLCARLEAVKRIDDRAFWLTGLIHEAAPREARLTAISPEGVRSEIDSAAMLFHRRPAYSEGLQDDDTVSTLGFHAYAELDSPSVSSMGWMLEFETASGETVEDTCRNPLSEQLGSIRGAMKTVLRQEPLEDVVLEKLVLPVLERLRNAPDQPQILNVVDFGHVPERPVMSAVIAVRKFDRVQHQLVEFARDPEMADVELIFVAPSQRPSELEEVAAELYELYGIPFRLAILTQRARPPRALNLGAELAKGTTLVLMSGDAFPRNPGWIGAMSSMIAGSATIAAVSPKLLREDDSIAHAGAEYVNRVHPPHLRRVLSFVGMARTMEAANNARPISAGQDACLMVVAEHFRGVGGFLELYQDGDEAGDLCLRLADRGGETWYCPEAEVYLLDRPDKPVKPPRGQTIFNEWLFKRRWNDRLGSQPPDRGRTPWVTPADGAAAGAGGARAAAAAHARGPDSWVSPLRGDPFERIEVVMRELGDDGLVYDAMVRCPRDEDQSVFAGTYTLWIDGWAIGRDGQPLTIELRNGDETLRSVVADLPAPKAPPRHADIPGADGCGFSIAVGSLGLPLEFDLALDACTGDGARTTLARVVGRRRPVRTGYRALMQPLLVTQLGRSGSSWAVTLLSRHQDIIALHPLRSETKQALYWSSVLNTLAQPKSYMKSLLSGPFSENWWIGAEPDGRFRVRDREPTMPRWLGSANVEIMAGFCQSRADDFYAEVARMEGKPSARYFVEKADPIDGPNLIRELWPGAREIILVRDFRDWFCSIVGYNAKRGLQGWLRDKTEDDAEWIAQLRGSAERLLTAWRERRETAHLVRYEDLVADPQSTLTGIFSYLELDAGTQTVEQVIHAAENTFPEAQDAHSTSANPAASVGRWRTDLSAEHLSACAEAFDDILVEFGYEATGRTAPEPDPASAARGRPRG